MSKLKKGDKILGQSYEDLGMFKGEVYTVRSCTETSMTLEECFDEETGYHYTFTPSSYEISTKRDYREMSPNDLITISVEGIESEVPLGDIVHAVAILGVTNGYHGARIWEALHKPFDPEGFVQDMDTVVEFRDKQKEALDYFFKPYYDKQQQEKDELKKDIELQKEILNNQQQLLKELEVKLLNM